MDCRVGAELVSAFAFPTNGGDKLRPYCPDFSLFSLLDMATRQRMMIDRIRIPIPATGPAHASAIAASVNIHVGPFESCLSILALAQETVMSVKANKDLIHRFFAFVNAGDFDAFPQLLAPDYHLHFDGMPPLDSQGAAGFFQGFFTAFPDVQHEIVEQIAEGDLVATRIIVHGTHRGDFMGIPSTGREISIGAVNLHRVIDNQIAEQWVNADSLGMLQQLGAVPGPALA
jgi:steroid delta-isomerase-like uncharacterized protein